MISSLLRLLPGIGSGAVTGGFPGFLPRPFAGPAAPLTLRRLLLSSPLSVLRRPSGLLLHSLGGPPGRLAPRRLLLRSFRCLPLSLLTGSLRRRPLCSLPCLLFRSLSGSPLRLLPALTSPKKTAIVAGSALRVSQNFISSIYSLYAPCRSGTLVMVWVIYLRQPSVGGSYSSCAGVSGHTQHFVMS